MSIGQNRNRLHRLLASLLLILALAAPGTSRADHETIVIDGDLTDLINVVNDNLGPSEGGFSSLDPIGEIYTVDCSYVNGYDIGQSYFFLDFKDEDDQPTPDSITLYVGWDMSGVIGDVDGDGDPNTFDPVGPGGSTGCAVGEEFGIGVNESYNLLLDLDCIGGVDDIRIQVKNNAVLRLYNNQSTMIPGAEYAVSGDKLELKVPNYQNLLSDLENDADPCDARFRFSANAGFDGVAEDITSSFLLTLDPSVRVDLDPATQSVCAGSSVSWTITVTNDGLCRLTDITVEDVLGAGLSFVSSNNTPTSVNGQTVLWEFPGVNLAPGGTIVLTLNAVSQTPCAGPTLENSVSVVGVHNTPCDPIGTPSPTSNDTDQATVTCRDLPSCEISGDDHTSFPSTETYTSTVAPPFTRLWSLSSTPPGICSTDDPLTGSAISVNYTGAGVCTLSLTVRDPLDPNVCVTTCEFLTEVIAMDPCIITGAEVVCIGTSQTFASGAGSRFEKSWTVTSSPEGICNTSGPTDESEILVNFTGAGQCTVSLTLFDKNDPTDCVTTCSTVVNVQDCGCRSFPACYIAGDSHTGYPSTETYSTNVDYSFNRLWSISSTPEGICNTTDPLNGSSINVNFTGAGVCTVSLTLIDPQNPQYCYRTCESLVTVAEEAPCIIGGQNMTCLGSSQTFYTNVGDRYEKKWTVVSTPPEICHTIGSNTNDYVLIDFFQPGQCTITLALFDKEDPSDCVTICEETVTVLDCYGYVDPYSVMGEGCLVETPGSGRKDHAFGGNVDPASRGSWRHTVTERNRTEFSFTTSDALIDSCYNEESSGTCTPHGDFNSIAWSGTGRYTIRNGHSNASGTFKACMRECDNNDYYEITVFDLNQTVVFQTAGYISCGDLQMPEFHGIQGIKPIADPDDPDEDAPLDARNRLTTRPFPNPVTTSATSIDYRIPARLASADVGITIFDVTGRAVRTITPGAQSAGDHSVNWNLRDEDGAAVTSGIYFYRLTVGVESITEKLMVTRR